MGNKTDKQDQKKQQIIEDINKKLSLPNPTAEDIRKTFNTWRGKNETQKDEPSDPENSSEKILTL